MIIVGQCAGALLGALLGYYILSVNGEVPETLVPILAPSTAIDSKGANGFGEDFQTFWS